MISERVKAALAAAKSRGTKLAQAARSKAHQRRVSALGNAAIRKAAMECAEAYCMDATCRAATESAACPSSTWADASQAGRGQINPYPSRREGTQEQ